MIDPNNPFTVMQKKVYAEDAAKWSLEDKDPVVGSWDEHEAWQDYDLLFEGLDTKSTIALDFGCGPGRMIVRYRNRFKRIDGADIDPSNLDNVKSITGYDNGFNNDKTPIIYLVNGVSLDSVYNESYDLIFSTLCLQHIPVYDIRLNLFKEFYRVLKPGGWFTAQMGFGETSDPRGVDYYENRWYADATNGGCDAKVTRAFDLSNDLSGCGFREFSSSIRPTGPNDWHLNWIWFRAQKPRE